MSTVIVPKLSPYPGFNMWHISEIYTGTGTGEYVPNVGDGIIDWDAGIYRVTDVDVTTGLSTKEAWQAPSDNNTADDVDIILGTGPGEQSESFRVFIDTSTLPYTLAVSSFLNVYGSKNTHVKLFKGTDISSTGEIISAYYDTNGTFLGENIPLEGVPYGSSTSNTVKVPMVAACSQTLEDNDVVTIVAYTATGKATCSAKLLVSNTAFIRSADASLRYITDIAIKSTYLSATDPTVLEYPINVPISTVNVRGVVTYSDGSSTEHAIDGDKFALFGLDNYIATVLGQRSPLVLSYKLSADEYCYNIATGKNGRITKPYYASSVKVSGTYAVKLFVFPVWVSAIQGYRLEYYMYSLDRDEVYYATPYVVYGATSGTFEPLTYGVAQTLNVQIDLSRVNGKFNQYRHAQTFTITLLKPGTENLDNWMIEWSQGNGTKYGVGLAAEITAVNVNQYTLDISCNMNSEEEWLRNVYNYAEPIYDSSTEAEPPVPNYMVIVYGNTRVEKPISVWNSAMTMTSGLAQGKNVYIEFIKRTPVTDLKVGIAALPVHLV